MPHLSKPFLWLICVLLGLTAAVAQPAATPIEGTWDLTWATRRGPEQRGYLVMTRAGQELRAEIHGRGHVRARGQATGSTFSLRGSRMGVPYRLAGRWQGDRLEGSLKVLSVERRFTEVRRRR